MRRNYAALTRLALYARFFLLDRTSQAVYVPVKLITVFLALTSISSLVGRYALCS